MSSLSRLGEHKVTTKKTQILPSRSSEKHSFVLVHRLCTIFWFLTTLILAIAFPIAYTNKPQPVINSLNTEQMIPLVVSSSNDVPLVYGYLGSSNMISLPSNHNESPLHIYGKKKLNPLHSPPPQSYQIGSIHFEKTFSPQLTKKFNFSELQLTNFDHPSILNLNATGQLNIKSEFDLYYYSDAIPTTIEWETIETFFESIKMGLITSTSLSFNAYGDFNYIFMPQIDNNTKIFNFVHNAKKLLTITVEVRPLLRVKANGYVNGTINFMSGNNKTIEAFFNQPVINGYYDAVDDIEIDFVLDASLSADVDIPIIKDTLSSGMGFQFIYSTIFQNKINNSKFETTNQTASYKMTSIFKLPNKKCNITRLLNMHSSCSDTKEITPCLINHLDYFPNPVPSFCKLYTILGSDTDHTVDVAGFLKTTEKELIHIATDISSTVNWIKKETDAAVTSISSISDKVENFFSHLW